MNYNRLFYRNITFICNNNCKFCISHNTKNKNTSIIENSLESIKICDSEYNINNNDLFIISGGEPTVSNEFSDIVNYLLKTKCKIVVYTNGRRLNVINQNFFSEKNIRWIIPFYGLSEIHDYYTNVKNSYYETFECINKLPREFLERFSIKFLIKTENQIQDFYELYSLLNYFPEFHFSVILNNDVNEQISITGRVSDLIQKTLNDGKKVKISNMPLCSLSDNLKSLILQNYDLKMEMNIGDYYFIKKRITAKMEYDRLHNWLKKCSLCSLHKICTDNYLCYRPLAIKNGIAFLDEE